MARGGSKPGERRGGRQVGARNKRTIATLDREEIRQQVLAEIRAANAATTAEQRTRAKDVMEEFLPIIRGITAYHQPTYPGMAQQNDHGSEPDFIKWFGVLLDLTKALAPFQSPTFKAIAVHVQAPAPQSVQPAADGSNVIHMNDPIRLARTYQTVMDAGRKAG